MEPSLSRARAADASLYQEVLVAVIYGLRVPGVSRDTPPGGFVGKLASSDCDVTISGEPAEIRDAFYHARPGLRVPRRQLARG